jgi:hypothetical protein
MCALSPDIDLKAKEWMRLDAESASRNAMQQLVDAGSDSTLRELLCQRLEFGESHEPCGNCSKHAYG